MSEQKLIEMISALLALDEKRALVPHGLGGHARELLTRSATALADYDAVAAQRDEGLAREAELKQRLAEVEKPQPVFVATVLRKLRRFEECASDGQGADIGKHWFEVLTRLGLLNRVQRSPAWWELTDEGEQFLASLGCADGEQPS